MLVQSSRKKPKSAEKWCDNVSALSRFISATRSGLRYAVRQPPTLIQHDASPTVESCWPAMGPRSVDGTGEGGAALECGAPALPSFKAGSVRSRLGPGEPARTRRHEAPEFRPVEDPDLHPLGIDPGAVQFNGVGFRADGCGAGATPAPAAREYSFVPVAAMRSRVRPLRSPIQLKQCRSRVLPVTARGSVDDGNDGEKRGSHL